MTRTSDTPEKTPDSSGSKAGHLRADLALLAVAAIWGGTFPLIRGALDHVDPPRFLAARFGLAALAFLPLLRRRHLAQVRHILVPGFVLGAIAWSSYLFQTIGLTTVGAGRAAFVTGMNVVIVPLIAPFFRTGRPGVREVLAALVATGGLYLLTDPGGRGLVVGDLWVLGCASAYAVYLHTLSGTLEKHRPDPAALAFVQVATLALLGLAGLPFADPAPRAWTLEVWGALAFCATLATVGTFWLQARFQGETTATRAALMFASEPVFAAGFAFLALGETLGWVQGAGAAVILVAVLWVELEPRTA